MAAASELRSFHLAKILLLFCLVPAFVLSDEKLYLSIPKDSIQLDSSVTSIKTSQLPSVILNALGFTAPIEQSWIGIKRTQPFSHPKAAVLIDIIGDSAFSLPLSQDVKSYELTHDEGIQEVYEAVRCQFSNELFGKNYIDVGLWDYNEIRHIKADNNELLGSITDDFNQFLQNAIKESSLNVSEVDSFLSELNFLIKLSESVATSENVKNTIRDFYVFRINFVSALQSSQRNAAVAVLEKSLDYIQKNFEKAYNDQIVFLTEVVDAENNRKTRSLLEVDNAAASETSTKAPTPNWDDYKLAKPYTTEYQVTFAMVLFLVIVLILTMLTISLVLWNMDPGRDSIIYRMTNQRVKMD